MLHDLTIYKKSQDFLTWIYPVLSKLPRSEKYSLGKRMEDILVEILEGVIIFKKGGYTHMLLLSVLLSIILAILSGMACADPTPSPEASKREGINYTIITADYLEEADGEIEKNIKKILPDAGCHLLNYETDEAKKIIAELDLRVIPFVYFDEGLEQQDEFFYLVQNMMIEKRRMYYVIPEKQIRNNMVMYLDRELIPKRLDLFVMSFCPYGQNAEKELMDFLKSKETNLEAKVRYITKSHEYGINSMHGPEEIREDVWQIIIQKHFPDKFFDYLKARRKMSFEAAAESLSLDQEFIDSKEGEGLQMLEEDAELAEEMDISLSPTFVLFNKFAFHSLDKLPSALGVRPTSSTGVSRSESFKLEKIGDEIKGRALTVEEKAGAWGKE